MAFQGERGQGGIGMCFNVGSMARDGFFYNNPTANFNQWGSSPPYTEQIKQLEAKARLECGDEKGIGKESF